MKPFESLPYLSYTVEDLSSRLRQKTFVFNLPIYNLMPAYRLLASLRDEQELSDCTLTMVENPRQIKTTAASATSGQLVDTLSPASTRKSLLPKIKYDSSRWVLSFDLRVPGHSPKTAQTLSYSFYDAGYPMSIEFSKNGSPILMSESGNIVLAGEDKNAELLTQLDSGFECVLTTQSAERGEEIAASLARLFQQHIPPEGKKTRQLVEQLIKVNNNTDSDVDENSRS